MPLSFLAGAFAIAGAIGASIPLIIHLLNRERARRLIFSTVRFIQMSHQTNVQRHKLKRLLLLLMRILMLILLGLAFARPFFAQDITTTPELGGVRNAVIILDTSYSMQYEEIFDNAKKEAIKRLDSLDSADAVALILSADKVQKVLPIDSEHQHIRTAIENAELTNYTTDYLDAIQTADEILKSISVGQKQIYLVADLQKSGWENFLTADRLGPDVDIEFIDVSKEQPDNRAITTINVPPVILLEQKNTELVARVHNFSTERVENLPVSLFIDNKKVEMSQLDIEPNDSSDVVFNVKIDLQTESAHTGWIEIESDALEIDNRHYFTVQSMKSIKVHCVNGESNRNDIYDETFFLTRALKNTGTDGAPIDYTESTTFPSDNAIKQYDVLILANVSSISATEADRLKTYVNDGGGLIITVGDQVDSDVYQQQLGEAENPLLPCTLTQATGDAIGKETFQVIASVDYRHPIFMPFSNPNHGDFAKGRFYRFYQSAPVSDATVLASFDDGNPAIVEKIYGNGRVLCYTSSIDREWNDLPIHGVYLPFLHETIKYLALKQAGQIPDYRVGDGIEYSGSQESAGKEVAVFDPDRKESRFKLNEQGNLFYENSENPGIYSIHKSDEKPQYFAVNVDTVESDLTPRNPEELTSMLIGNTETDRTPTELTDKVIKKYEEDVERNQSLSTYLLLAVFALAITEMFLANRI
ncbi:VWA domain-containing protein [Candidatus Poribacteria bacterium]|nr:VWA domain-containing protein [Candidatus Poribacteria bacterium]